MSGFAYGRPPIVMVNVLDVVLEDRGESYIRLSSRRVRRNGVNDEILAPRVMIDTCGCPRVVH